MKVFFRFSGQFYVIIYVGGNLASQLDVSIDLSRNLSPLLKGWIGLQIQINVCIR